MARPSSDEQKRIGSGNQPHGEHGHFAAGQVPGTVSGHGKKGGPYAVPHSPKVAGSGSGGVGGSGGGGGSDAPASGESVGGVGKAGKKKPMPEGLTPGQADAVRAWLSQYQGQINKAAIGGNEGQWKQVIQDLDAAIAAAPPLDKPQKVYRELPGVEKLAAGTVVKAKGFTATSPSPLSASASEIMVPTGVHALDLPEELLLPRGIQLRVDGPRQLTVVASDDSRRLSFYRSLWLRAESDAERAKIVVAVGRFSGDQRP